MVHPVDLGEEEHLHLKVVSQETLEDFHHQKETLEDLLHNNRERELLAVVAVAQEEVAVTLDLEAHQEVLEEVDQT